MLYVCIDHSLRFSPLKSSCQTVSCKKETAPRQPHRLQTVEEASSGSKSSAWPTSPTLHPTLMEKLRLSTPASGHEGSPAFGDHRLKSHSPFPKLHSYYVHSTPAHQQDRTPVPPNQCEDYTTLPPSGYEQHTSFQG